MKNPIILIGSAITLTVCCICFSCMMVFVLTASGLYGSSAEVIESNEKSEIHFNINELNSEIDWTFSPTVTKRGQDRIMYKELCNGIGAENSTFKFAYTSSQYFIGGSLVDYYISTIKLADGEQVDQNISFDASFTEVDAGIPNCESPLGSEFSSADKYEINSFSSYIWQELGSGGVNCFNTELKEQQECEKDIEILKEKKYEFNIIEVTDTESEEVLFLRDFADKDEIYEFAGARNAVVMNDRYLVLPYCNLTKAEIRDSRNRSSFKGDKNVNFPNFCNISKLNPIQKVQIIDMEATESDSDVVVEFSINQGITDNFNSDVVQVDIDSILFAWRQGKLTMMTLDL